MEMRGKVVAALSLSRGPGPGWGPGFGGSGIFPPIGGFFAGFSDMIFYLVSAAAGFYEIALEGRHHHHQHLHFFLLIIDRSPESYHKKERSFSCR
ncbi:hypothetical protein DY000_02036149 [Brassica cretica]|uniref:Uncharacterized protein n=1 Tax=Brassica cretica TaxID=69181 RepID=A0ABQ7DM02_BRACR|nr:hypothetical protein DY000_02036149 [Brassica cretica]